jgi:ATP-dependent DNA helicase RecQ
LGYSIEKIAQTRSLKQETVYNHLAKHLEIGTVTLDEVLALSAAEIQAIETGILALSEVQRNALKPVYEYFEGAYSYEILRCVRAALQRQIK